VTLRLRLTLFYTVLIALVLAASGVGLHLLLQRNLYQSLDNSLREATMLLSTLTIDVEEPLRLQDEEGAVPLPADLTALLFDANDSLIDNLGRVPAQLPPIALGFSTWDEWRVYGESVRDGTLVVLRAFEPLEESLRQFDLSFLILAPLAIVLAFVLGYGLAGRALRPVTSLTKAAYDLAQRRAWREVLPEPQQRDELWQLTKATNTLLETLAQVIETERRFTADAAHELRTPLTVLQGRLEQALERNRDGDLATLLGKSKTALEALLGLVEKLLLLARTEAQQGLTKESLNLNEVVLETSQVFREQFAAKGLVFKLVLPDRLTLFQGDRTALELLLRNLLENAYKFTEHGEINLTLSQDAQQAVISVEDTGVGLSEAALPHLFERFYQTDVRHRQQGSGLGLALVQSIASWHGGSVKAENLSDGGSRFTVVLPKD
jgi:two-component system, OmpR family, sensor kinase